jgi:CelD/BcsL family acetyltransferase involved in cellulose biosynthesis
MTTQTCATRQLVKFESFSNASAFEQLKAEWNVLLRCSSADQVFYTWEWYSTWWEVYRPGELWLITSRDEQGRLLGIAPLYIDDVGVVRLIGSGDVTDYVDMIIDADYVAQVLEGLATYLLKHRTNFNSLQLEGIPEASPTLKLFSEVLERQGFSVDLDVVEVCPLINLPEKWESYFKILDKKQRHEVRRKMRRAAGLSENIDWYIVDSSHDLSAEIERFMVLMAASDAEKQEFLQNPLHKQFFKRVIPLLFDKGWLQLNFLTVDGMATAAYLNFDYNDQILVYNSGLSHEQYGYLSPGIVLLTKNIRYAIENGYRVFDFLRGDETYKYRMGGKDTKIYGLTASIT